jgi:hypothetical protein
LGEKLVVRDYGHLRHQTARFLMFYALLSSINAAQDQKCHVEGQVFSVTGLPLKRTTVRLEAASQSNQSNFANYTVSTDNEGKFSLEDITPGTYILSAERAGYLRRYYGAKSTAAGATQIKLDAGKEMTDIRFQMTPQGMIFGKVMDDEGEPLPSFAINAMRWVFVNGNKLLRVTGIQTSQADGTFVMGNLPAGRYSITAQSENNSFRYEVPGNKKPMEVYLKTYFPNASDTASATPVDVAPGAEVRGIEIRVRHGRVFDISGRFQNPGGAPVLSWANLELTPKDMTGIFNQRVGVTNGKADVFQFKNVPPGAYVIKTRATGADHRGLLARYEVVVDDRNLENLVVPLMPEVEIKGTIKSESGAVGKVSIQFRNSQGASSGNAEPAPDGTFRMQGVIPDVVRLDVFGLTGNTYAKTVRFEGRDVRGKELDLSAVGGGTMEIVVSPNGAEVTGVVRDADGKPVPDAVVQICVRDDVRFMPADLSGAFDFKGLPPGDYKVFAWEDDGDGVVTVADFRRSFESKASVLKLEEKGREKVEVVVIGKDAMDVEAGKIR